MRDARLVKMEMALSWLLRIGVVASCAAVLLGLALLLITGQTGYAKTTQDCLPSSAAGSQTQCADYPTTLTATVQGVREMRPFAIIAFGLLLLIATPIARVVVSVFTFAWERDYLYVAFTAFVMVMLLISFLVGKAGE